MHSVEENRGFTLIETLIYIALFMLLIGSGLVAAYYIIDSSERNKVDLSVTTEAQFLLRKIDWALTGSAVTSPTPNSSDDVLSLNKLDVGNIGIELNGTRAQISLGGSDEFLTAERVVITDLLFNHIPEQGEKPAAIEASFTANGKDFQMIKYFRK